MSIPAPKAAEEPAKRLVNWRGPGYGVVRVSQAVLVPVLRGNELNKALVAHPRAAKCIQVARVSGLPQVYRRNRSDGRPEGMTSHDEGMVGIRLEGGPD